ncbi:MAG: lycopene cyclase protein [Subtercola sp.]|nr:lycopene cyclase protein [Subtercola sp.]
MGVLYLLGLLVALTGMVLLDRRFRLFFWQDARRAGIVLVVGVLFFLGWDVAGIGLGIFFRGETTFMTGIVIARELPLEELFFLTLLCYLTMNLFAAVGRMLGRFAPAEPGPDHPRAGSAPASDHTVGDHTPRDHTVGNRGPGSSAPGDPTHSDPSPGGRL